LYVHRAAALSNNGPDAADFATGNAYYTLSNTVDVVNTTSMGLSIYYPGAAPAAGVTINVIYQGGAGQCANQNAQGNGGVNFTYGNGAVFRQNSLTIPAGAWTASGTGSIATFGAFLQNGTNVCSGGADGNHVNFKLSAPGGYTIGPAGAQYFAIAQSSYCVTFNASFPSGVSCNGYINYSIPFAPPCTAAGPGGAPVDIYDMDNTGHPVIQPSPASVQVIDTTTGAVVNNNSFVGSEANAQTASFWFPYTPLHNYRLQINNVNANNVLQIRLPFDSAGHTTRATRARSCSTMCTPIRPVHRPPTTQVRRLIVIS
jgi:hypothetical protein